ncbi:MAG: hypothetical protein HDR08_05830 [Lachnospiraceae bacterium]|nr:hypothetical protein [Lachnospiraceae bacterium]
MGKVRINAEYVNDTRQSFIESIYEYMELDTYLSDALGENEICFGQNTTNFDQMLSGTSKFFFFIGYRRTGKTMFLKQYFKMNGNTPFIDKELKRLVLPILGCGDAEDKLPYDRVADAIRGLCDRIAYEYPQTQQQFTALGIEEFFQFIMDTRIDYLPELTFSEESKLSQAEQHCARIDKMQKANRLAYQLSRLKFYLQYYCSDIKELVVVLDNIQNIFNESKKQKEFMDVFMDAFECVQNKGINSKGNWKIFIVTAVRPHDYRIIKSFDKISSYANNKIWNDSRINSANLFGKMIEKDTKGADYEKIIELDSEMVSSNSSDFGMLLSTLSQKFGCKYATMIEKLCFYNMDLIMNAYKRILVNITWVREGGFRFTSDGGCGNGLAFNNITCIRALACGNERIYKRWENLNEMEELDKLIPNVLYNEEDSDYRLINLYTMKYYLRHFDSKMELGENYIVLNDYMDTFCSLLDINLQTCVFSTTYLFQREVLRRSVYDTESVEGTPYNDFFGTDNKLYITSRGTALWDMFRNDSVLLEICREDMYLLDDMTEDDTKSSYDLMMEGKQFILFSKLLNIIKEIFEQEFSYYQQACLRGLRDKYRETFGKQPISMVLLEGVTKSIQYSGCNSIMKNRNELETEIITKWKEWGK